MLPSLVAEDLRASLTSFLGTTFALADDDVRAELERFVADPEHGVFRGPFVRLRLPFRPADDAWRQHLDWAPDGFTPHHHQAEAWMRLASRDRMPQPTLVTTGTGSGKTESFLIPLLDHCRRQLRAGQRGIKALVLYPMNALANDQARRIARLVHTHSEALGGVRVGLYTGDSGKATAMSETGVIEDKRAMRADPPDILLTNYKMLDMLLLRREDVPLFAGAGESLRYLVLDEFHTYDGAQGTDVAMLLRRLGMALEVATDARPLGAVTPVATSATLGGGSDGGPKLREFAATVFGAEFDEAALVGEDRLTVEEWTTGPAGRIPLLDRVNEALRGCTSHEDQLRAGAHLFGPDEIADLDPQVLGEWLRAHPFTHRLLRLAARPVSLIALAAEVEPSWAASDGERRAAGRHALALYLALLSRARDGARPLLGVDVQFWVREVSRLLRRLSSAPAFQWHEGAAAEDGSLLLPSVFCRHCGRSGWGVVATAAGGHDRAPTAVWSNTAGDRSVSRAWIHAPGEAAEGSPDVVWVDPETADVVPVGRPGAHIPVIVTADAKAAKDGQCPSCGRPDGIRFLGSRVATLASTTLGQLFGSPDIAPDEKKTLVFTDSVQDASHRAAFVERRAYALNLRALVHRAIGDEGWCSLDEVGARIEEAATSLAERYAMLPPDLREHEIFQGYWKKEKPEDHVRRAVAKRMSFAATLEFGLSSRTGRTLELTGTVTAHVEVNDVRAVADAALAQAARQDVQLALDGAEPEHTVPWVRGVVERIRTQGGIGHPWLRTFAETDNRYSIWGGRPRREGMPAFPKGRPAPAFPTTARHTDHFDPVIGTRGWYSTWTACALGVPVADASRYVLALFDALVTDGVLTTVRGVGGSVVWQIPPTRVVLIRTDDTPAALRCGVCATRFPGPEIVVDELVGAPCHRDRCPGRYSVERFDHDYYRDLYRGGRVRRIVAREHTSLLPAKERVELENAFKAPRSPAAPNVLACTPTLELGIDIGDLSMVALTSLPRSTASYLQRVGRAGRLTGNALVVSLLPARPLELQRLTDPLTMIAGDVVPPACYLDATEILRRQYLASLVDRHARSAAPSNTWFAKDVFAGGLSPTSWLGKLVADARANAAEYVDAFLRGFGDAVKDSAKDLRYWAGDGVPADEVPGLERAVQTAVVAWNEEGDELAERLSVISAEIARMEEKPSLDEAGERDLKRLRGELGAARRMRSERERAYWISALEAKGLLPNYALLDDTTRLDVGLWWTDEETGEHKATDEQYVRGSRTALAELAPGATFYVRGTSVEIDGVDLGTTRNPATVTRRFCPACGWSERVGPDATAGACPRCHAAGAADSGQLLTTLPFRRASAYASREVAMRDDDTDERRRTRFTVLTTVETRRADIVGTAWELDGYPFGAEVLRAADIRWLNFGPSERGGATRMIAGQEVTTPLFDTCRHCGIVPLAQRGVRERADARHRGWCRQRREPDPDGWISLALTHELRTQAVRLLVPPIALVDRTVRASFRAALLLGLREVLGGDPDHLDVVEATDPAGSSERWVMVLHDLVPGGTGYLARFVEPDRVRELLEKALEVLRDCPCREDGVAACHRCLLPHVAPHLADDVRRSVAIDLLAEVLAHWRPRPIETITGITPDLHDTPIEKRFRTLLLRWAKARGAALTVTATAQGDSATIHFPQALGDGRWQLVPQVKLGGVMPDFVLTSVDTQVPRIAVFCDSKRWHSSLEANRLADDAAKRAALRDRDLLVWAVTHRDLDAFATVLDGKLAAPTSWIGDPLRSTFLQVAQKVAAPGSVRGDVLLTDALSLLTAFLLRPDRTAWQSPAHALALALCHRADVHKIDSSSIADLLRGQFGEKVDVAAGPAAVVTCRSPHGAVVAVDRRSIHDVRPWIVVDDHDDAIGTPEQVEAWHDWLALGNVLQFVESGRFHALTRSLLTTVTADETEATAALSPAWQEIADVSEGESLDLVRGLAALGLPVPEAGHEVDDGEYVVDLAWPDRRIAVSIEGDDDRDAWLVAHGWTVVPPEAAAVRAAVEGARGWASTCPRSSTGPSTSTGR